MFLFFDTETTGLPRNWKAPASDVNNWPRMIQIAWILSDNPQDNMVTQEYIIRPEGFVIPEEASKVHGITTERAMDEGKDLSYVLHEFNALVNDAKAIVAHNINFDEKIIGAEFIRNNLPTQFNNKPKLCTMKNSTEYCRIPGKFGYKWPKLSELHIKLFGEDFEGAHDALADIRATAKCFWEMRALKLI